jgi:integrase
MQRKRSPHPGIRVRHRHTCPAGTGGRCSCQPTYEAWAYSPRERRKIRRSFPTLAAARAWRLDAQTAIRGGTLRTTTQTTLRDAAAAFLAGAHAGSIRTRSGDRYKPSALRSYEAALERLLPELGSARLSHIQRFDLQDLADRLLADGLSPSTIRNLLMPLRVIFRRAVARGEVSLNPTTGLELPTARGQRDRVASPEEARRLIAALPLADRALWATALYAGLRRGELQALRWENVDLAGGTIHVERAWDEKSRVYIEPKSRAGTRRVPIAALLRDELLEHKLRSRRDDGLVFATTPDTPFVSSSLWRRTRTAWRKADLAPIGLHEARHTCASLMIAAGVNAKALSTYLGHASVTITLDRYGHLLPGNENEAAALLDTFLARSAHGDHSHEATTAVADDLSV